MIGKTLRKIVVALIIIAPVISYSGCKKQAKCGCGQDVLYTLTAATVNVYFNDTKSLLYFMTPGDPYSQYKFCNPTPMIEKLGKAKSGDQLQVSGHVYYDCTYVYQASNSSYQSLGKVYQVEATDLFQDLYGKGSPASGAPINSAKPKN
jgi:hypothetical protein